MFYTKFIQKETLIEQLDTLNLSMEEKVHLSTLIDSSLHHLVLDEILSNLSTEDKKLFIDLISHEKDHQKIYDFLTGKIENIENRIKKISDELIEEMHGDIKEAKEKYDK